MGSIETISPFQGRRHRNAIIGVLCAAMLLACPMGVAFDDGEVVEESEAVVPAIMLAGAIIVFVATAITTYTLLDNYGDSDIPEGTVDDSVNATLRELQAQLVTSNYDTASGIWSQLAVNDAQLWSFVESYFDNQAEMAAATLWSDTGSYDGDKILESSSFIYNSVIYNYNITAAWNEFTQSWSDYPLEWNGDDAYDGMALTFSWDTDSMTAMGPFAAELMRFVTPTTESDRIYIDIVPSDEEGYLESTNVMHCMGASGTLTSTSTGRTIQLSEGENDLEALGLTSGWYELGMGTTYISQNISGSVSEDGLMPSACMMLTCGGETAYVYESGGSFAVVKGGISEITESVALEVAYDGPDGSESISVDLGRVISAYTDISDALNHAAMSVTYAGETAWNVYDMIGQSSALIKPSSITAGSQTDAPLTTDQAAVMYVAAMQQIAALGNDATVDGIQISPESLGLIVYGDIYYEGVKIAENAVYTPFVYSDAEIAVGSQYLGVNGLAMVWATDVPSLGQWDGKTSDATILSISGATLDVGNIVANGSETSSISLEVASMERLGLIGFDVPEVPDTPATIDVVFLLQIIIVLLGAVVAVAGLATRNPWLILIGALIAVVGYLLAGWIAGMIW